VNSNATFQACLFDTLFCELLLFYGECQSVNFATERTGSLEKTLSEGSTFISESDNYLNGKTSPAAAKFEDSVPGLHAGGAKNMVNFPELCSFQVPRAGAHLKISSNTTFCFTPKAA
jgi:hypothetical protein